MRRKISHRAFAAAVGLIAVSAAGQVGPRGAAARIAPADLAILDSPSKRKELPCRVERMKPQLAFDLRFHAGYRALLPIKEVAGTGDLLRVLARVRPVEKPENEIFLGDGLRVPPLANVRGEVVVSGAFALGPGKYQVDWLMRNRSGRVCSTHWEVNVKDSGEEVTLAIARDTAVRLGGDRFRQQPPVEREPEGRLLHVKVLANFSPSNPRDVILKPWDLEAMAAILRAIAREPWIGRFSVVAFNMQEERVIFRQDNVERINFPALGAASEKLRLGVIDYRRLIDRNSGTRFLTRLLTEHLGPQEPEPDAIAIVGPKLVLEQKISRDVLKEAGRARGPVFYFNYNIGRYHPWRDTIGSALRAYEGQEYTIALPQHLGAALSDMMSRLGKVPS